MKTPVATMIRYSFVCAAIVFFLLDSAARLSAEEVPHDHEHEIHPLGLDAAAIRAIKKMRQLTREGTIERTWAGQRPQTMKKKKLGSQEQWVATFNNATINKEMKIYVSIDGTKISVDKPILD